MKLKIYIVLVSLLSGCAMQNISNDMIGNNFINYSPVKIDLIGYYTAAMGPYLSTYEFNSDGAGKNCHVQNGNVILHRLKIYSAVNDSFELITETGLKSKLTRNADKTLTINSYGQSFSLKKDRDLDVANLLCQEKLLN